MLKFNINERILNVIGKSDDDVKKELRVLLRPKGRSEMSYNNFNRLRNAKINERRDARSSQLKIIADYFGCKVDELYTNEWTEYIAKRVLIKIEAAA